MSDQKKNKLFELEKRAKKNIFVTGILTLLFAPFGYVYTRRYWVAIISFFALMSLIDFADKDVDGESLLGFFVIGVTIENIIFVRRAREKLAMHPNGVSFPEPVKSEIPTHKSNQGQNLELIILKNLKKEGEMTVSDIVIATEFPLTSIKETLLKLEKEQLIYGYNRETDGAVVYKNI